MLSLLPASVAFLATLANAEHFKHGPTFGWRGGRGSAYIVSAETTMWPGQPPNPQQPRLAVWPGMDTSGGLIQPIIVSTSAKEYVGCSGVPGHWCVFASYLKYPSSQKMGKQFSLDGRESLKMTFEWTNNGYDQKLIHNGTVKSQITSNTGKAKTFYTDTECQGAHTGVVNAHKYTDTKIVLSAAEPNWGKNPSNHMMACADKISTPDGGKTWVIPTIRVSKSNAPGDYPGANKAGPVICAGGE